MAGSNEERPKHRRTKEERQLPPKEEQGYAYVDPETGRSRMFHPEAEIMRYALESSAQPYWSEQWLREHPDYWAIIYAKDGTIGLVNGGLRLSEGAEQFFKDLRAATRDWKAARE